MEDSASKEEPDIDFDFQSLHPLPGLKHPDSIGSLRIPVENGLYILEHDNVAALGGLNPFSPKFKSLGLKYLGDPEPVSLEVQVLKMFHRIP